MTSRFKVTNTILIVPHAITILCNTKLDNDNAFTWIYVYTSVILATHVSE
jgi:hypothetical protein